MKIEMFSLFFVEKKVKRWIYRSSISILCLVKKKQIKILHFDSVIKKKNRMDEYFLILSYNWY